MRAVLRRAADTKSHHLVACNANMEPYELKLGDKVNEVGAQVEVLVGGVSTYRTEGVGG